VPITQLDLHNFSAFEKASLKLAPGLNVFIGVNGTGKTHAMKVAYALLEAARTKSPLAAKLAAVFRPDDDQPGRLVRRVQGHKRARVTLHGDDHGSSTEFSLETGGALEAHRRGWKHTEPAIFLPSREVLAMYEGFIHAYRERELSFDETYFDTCVALSANPIKGPKKVFADSMLARLRQALGGRVFLEGNRFYVKFHGDRARMEAHLVAEGLRKVASLERLVLNGTLTRNGYLFWDEPEANLNPRLTVQIAEVLRDLAKQGVQIFVTTHDLLLARRLSTDAKLEAAPETQFFLFHRPKAGKPVEVSQGDRLEALPENPISEEFSKQYAYELRVDAE
jgi:predicted ATPase